MTINVFQRANTLVVNLLLLGLAVQCAYGGQSVFDTAVLEQARQLRQQALYDDTAWDVVESLTTEIGARMGGSPADAKAVQWARQKLEAMGFDRVWLEPVTFRRWQRGVEQAEVLGRFSQPLTISALGGSPATPAEGISLPLAHFATVEALEAMPPGSLQGKIAFISNRMQRARDGSGYGPAVRARSRGPMIAAERGAEALLIRSIGTDDRRFPHTGNISNLFQRPRVPAAALSNPDADQLQRLLSRGEVKLKLTLGAGYRDEYTSHNVIGEITGAEKPGELILLGAHLDSWDLGTGAIDDGAGVGIVTAAAQLIGQLRQRPARSIRVVLFANEEQGLFGAKAYATAHRGELAQHILGAESDFGAGRVWRMRYRVNAAALSTMEAIHRELAPLGIELNRDQPASGGPDVGQIRMLGMPVVDLNQDGSDYFDYHHTPDDTLDKIDPQALQQNVAAWVVLAYLAAQSKQPFGPIAVDNATE